MATVSPAITTDTFNSLQPPDPPKMLLAAENEVWGISITLTPPTLPAGAGGDENATLCCHRFWCWVRQPPPLTLGCCEPPVAPPLPKPHIRARDAKPSGCGAERQKLRHFSALGEASPSPVQQGSIIRWFNMLQSWAKAVSGWQKWKWDLL